jgi:hypothetical protein
LWGIKPSLQRLAKKLCQQAERQQNGRPTTTAKRGTKGGRGGPRGFGGKFKIPASLKDWAGGRKWGGVVFFVYGLGRAPLLLAGGGHP